MKTNAKTAAYAISMIFGVLILFNASDAQAKKGIAIINTGEDITHLADVDAKSLEEVKASTGAQKPAIGYLYSEFGIFWLNLWTWDGKYVLFENDQVWDVTPEQAAKFSGVTVDELSKPFFYSVPPGLAILVILGLLFVAFMFFVKGDDDEDEPEKENAAAAE